MSPSIFVVVISHSLTHMHFAKTSKVLATTFLSDQLLWNVKMIEISADYIIAVIKLIYP